MYMFIHIYTNLHLLLICYIVNYIQLVFLKFVFFYIFKKKKLCPYLQIVNVHTEYIVNVHVYLLLCLFQSQKF